MQEVNNIKESIKRLIKWVNTYGYSGWDPYDWGSSPLASKLPYTFNFILSQVNLYSPFNFRPLLGIKKGISNKELALFAQAYLLNYVIEKDENYKDRSFELLSELYKRRIEWGEGVSWASYYFTFVRKGHVLSPNNPDIIATAEALKAYTLAYHLFKDESFKEISLRIIEEIKRNFIVVIDEDKKYVKYYPQESEKIVFNVSGLVLSSFAYFIQYIENDEGIKKIGTQIAKLLMDFQKKQGFWPYSYYLNEKKYKIQNDYHQGFIIVGLADFYPYYSGDKENIKKCIERGVYFYKNYQFSSAGWSYYRPPKLKYPIDIHNQAQGIITFSKLYKLFKNPLYVDFAIKIARWTIKNMQSHEGYFYTHRWPFMVNKIPYVRWGQAWMMLALANLLEAMEVDT